MAELPAGDVLSCGPFTLTPSHAILKPYGVCPASDLATDPHKPMRWSDGFSEFDGWGGVMFSR